MKRRHFLQLAMSAAAGAVSPCFAAVSLPSRYALSITPFSVEDTTRIGIRGSRFSLDGDPLPTRAPMQVFSIPEFNTREERYAMNAPRPPEPDSHVEMLLERVDANNQWIVNGTPFAEGRPFPLLPGKRYRLRIMNATGHHHPIHLQRQLFEVRRINQTSVSGVLQDSLWVERYNVVEADIIAGRLVMPNSNPAKYSF